VVSTITRRAQRPVRVMVWQLLAAVAVASLAWLFKGGAWSLAALSGGAAVALGNGLAAWVALGGGVGTAGSVLARMLLGMGLKWAVVIGALSACLALDLPILALLVGVVAVMAAQVLVLLGGSRPGGPVNPS